MTRDAILRAAVECLVDVGYSGLTTTEVTKRAEVSRGAMHHHFANRAELVSALIDHVLHRRLEFFLGDDTSSIESADPEDFIAHGAQVHWDCVQLPEYAAYVELAVAARTDKELAALLVPATNAFDREWAEEMEKVFPQWEQRREAMQLASDFVAAVHLGLLVNRPFMGNPERRSAVRDQLVKLIETIYEQADR